MDKISFSTNVQNQILDITEEVKAFLARNSDKGWKNGFICIFSPHTTCGVTLNEGFDPCVRQDMLDFLSHLVPNSWGFQHAEGNSDAHIKASMVGSSCLVPVEDGHIVLGKWQVVYLCEFDGPRLRSLCFSFLPAAG